MTDIGDYHKREPLKNNPSVLVRLWMTDGFHVQCSSGFERELSNSYSNIKNSTILTVKTLQIFHFSGVYHGNVALFQL